MINWFEIFAEKLAAIEEGQKELRNLIQSPPTNADANPYGDFNWLTATCAGIPTSTLRIKSAAGEIPGVVKFGKRVLYEKSIVLNWLRSQTRQAVDIATIEQNADLQIAAQLRKQRKGGQKAG